MRGAPLRGHPVTGGEASSVVNSFGRFETGATFMLVPIMRIQSTLCSAFIEVKWEVFNLGGVIRWFI